MDVSLWPRFRWFTVGLFAAWLEPVVAQDEPMQLDELTVHGQASTENPLQDQPNSASVYSSETLHRRGITAIQDIAPSVPNWNVMSFGARSLFSVNTIRGLGNTLLYSPPAVVYYVDDVPYGSKYSHTSQRHTSQSVEVYRGPQGARFGKNSYAGVVNVTTPAPRNEIDGQLTLQAGNFDRWNVDGAVSGAIIADSVFFNLGGAYARRDGYVENTFLGTRPDHQESSSGRAKLTWKPTERWQISVHGRVEDSDDGPIRSVPIGEAFQGFFKIRSDFDGEVEQKTDVEALRLSYQGEAYELLSVSARRYWAMDPFGLDIDVSPAPIAVQFATQDQTFWSQELQLRSHAPTSDWEWTLGGFASLGEDNLALRAVVLGNPTGETRHRTKEDAFAGFGYASYAGFAPLRLYGDLRIDSVAQRMDRTRTDPSGTVVPIKQRRDDWFVSPEIGIDYRLTSQALLYAKTGLAFKSGGFSPATDNPALVAFDRETMWGSEIGLKWSNHRHRAHLALFYYDIDDYQVERILSPLDITIVNAPKVTSYGVELELEAELWDGLRMETALGYINTEFDQYLDPVTAEDYADNKVPYVPEFSFMLAANYTHPKGLFARAEMVWKGDTEFDDSNADLLHEEDYTLFNARIGFERGRLSVYGWVNNLTDTGYFTFKTSTNTLIPSGTPGAPRSYGIQVGIRF